MSRVNHIQNMYKQPHSTIPPVQFKHVLCLRSSSSYLFDQMHAATLLPPGFSAASQSEVLVPGAENAARVEGSMSENTTPPEPEVKGEKCFC